ncbi:MAG: hypothetical protein IT383_11040 [Deltaproteobacteria bacterium]|nr:hypothetical protein [Deltaproteobacteria bacterium]
MKTRSRAYIMLEVAVGGAMIAVVIMGVLTALADGRTRNAYAGRDVIASQLVLAKLEEYRTMTRANAKAACTALSENPVPNQQGRYTRTCGWVDGSDALPGLISAIPFTTLTVTVSYPATPTARTLNAMTRVY